MNWLSRLFNPDAYDQGHRDGYQEGYKEGQAWGHDHGACEHTHPFDDALKAFGFAITVCVHCGRSFDPWIVNGDVARHTDLPIGSLVADYCISCGYPDCD